MATIGFLIVGFTSCGEELGSDTGGGTIVLNLNPGTSQPSQPSYYNSRHGYFCITDAGMKRVSENIYLETPYNNVKDDYEPVSHKFVVKDNGSYWICSVSYISAGNYSTGYSAGPTVLRPEKQVSMSGGNTVNVTVEGD
jgi:hypothetical protein